MTDTIPGTAEAVCAPQPDAHAIGSDVAAELATTLKALAEPLRLRMVSYVATAPAGEACVCDLAALTQVSQPTVSHHLKVLKDVGLLTSERRGTWVWYRIAPGFTGAVATVLDAFAPAVLARTAVTAAPKGLAGIADADAALDRLVVELADAYPVPLDVVRTTVRESYVGLARTAHVSAHLLTLTERFARQRLTDLARPADAPPQVLFVCVANAGRSQLAAALVRRYAGNRVVVRSAGSAPAADVHPGVRPALAALGADEAFCKPLTDDAVRAADVVVTMGCGDVCPVLPGVRYEDWKVGDPALASPAGVAAIRETIDARVRVLLGALLPDLELPPGPAPVDGATDVH
ncbi:ArsR family transcriptional regulator [Sediminihabitans luteus]|uniref:ArsR family transcriptional regulator n=1 Tax=Sediminihabitans luteus TaxID=1138585 RepID=A0A2M9CXZ9_9CELL|nr:metalloregulator ArsR/SmtB family transcription factor [Sediminihabitans luteus]PJJ76801.1 ArsR family transcriptional regulator [Sediminihabitans luteus]GIJ00279.1 hypothetical protein Slu03_26560 [Sediminihabitans luteus]